MCVSPSVIRSIKATDSLQLETPDQQSGVDIVRKALRAPCSTIAKNAGKDPSIVVEKILTAETPSIGYDALKDQYVDMIQEGEEVAWIGLVQFVCCCCCLHICGCHLPMS